MRLTPRRASFIKTMLNSRVCCGLLGLLGLGVVSAAASAAQLDTIYTAGNGGATGWIIYFDLQVTQPVRIDSFNVNVSNAAGAPFTLTVFRTESGQSYTANTTNFGAFTQVATGSGTTAGPNLPSSVDTSDFNLPAGTYGIGIRYDGAAMSYTNGNGTATPGSGTNQTYTSGPLTLLAGASQPAPFTGTLNQPRVWNGNIFFTLIGGNGACCSPSGACTVQDLATCAAPSLGRDVGSACAAAGGCPAPFGRCCSNSTGACALVAGSSGCGATSTYGGDTTTCSTACASVSTCCNPTTGACTAIFGGACPTGLDNGAGASCGPTSCQYGACCGGCAGCTVTPSASCSGAYAGNGTSCAAGCPSDGYTVATSPTTITFISGVDDTGNHCDDCATVVTFPFPINFYGASFTSGRVVSNGYLQFTTNVAGFTNACLPSNTVLGPTLFNFWDDQRTDIVAGAGIFTTTTGTAPNRTFVIEWRSYYYLTTPAAFDQNHEILLYENQNFFDVVYGATFADRGSATIGVQSGGAAASPSTQFECNTATATANSAIRFNCGVGVANGACCNNTSGSCSSATQANCPSGSTFQGVGTLCNPNPCPQPPSGVCCRGSTCSTTVTSATACTASLIPGQLAGAAFVSGSVCNSGPLSNAPCCYANYNKVGGISVQDIFDFLGDWFAGSQYANTGGNGGAGTLAVQNIFDFLSDWFAGGCN